MTRGASHSGRAAVVLADDARFTERATALAEQLGLRVLATDAAPDSARARFVLYFDQEGRLSLRDRTQPKVGAICARFDTVPIRHGRVAVSRDEPLGRAFGRDIQTIIDATAGLGHDAFLLACMGFQVTAIERNPIIAALLRDGVERAKADGRLRNAIEDRIEVIEADSISYLDALARAEADADADADGRPDAVYVDPMFSEPRRKRSALAKKTIRAVREIVGDDADSAALFAAAARAARRRVVVKRSDDAPPLAPNPVGSVMGKMVRYDLYAPAAVGSAISRQRLLIPPQDRAAGGDTSSGES